MYAARAAASVTLGDRIRVEKGDEQDEKLLMLSRQPGFVFVDIDNPAHEALTPSAAVRLDEGVRIEVEALYRDIAELCSGKREGFEEGAEWQSLWRKLSVEVRKALLIKALVTTEDSGEFGQMRVFNYGILSIKNLMDGGFEKLVNSCKHNGETGENHEIASPNIAKMFGAQVNDPEWQHRNPEKFVIVQNLNTNRARFVALVIWNTLRFTFGIQEFQRKVLRHEFAEEMRQKAADVTVDPKIRKVFREVLEETFPGVKRVKACNVCLTAEAHFALARESGRSLSRCSACARVDGAIGQGIWYCSKECQKKDWPAHKKICVKFAPVK